MAPIPHNLLLLVECGRRRLLTLKLQTTGRRGHECLVICKEARRHGLACQERQIQRRSIMHEEILKVTNVYSITPNRVGLAGQPCFSPTMEKMGSVSFPF